MSNLVDSLMRLKEKIALAKGKRDRALGSLDSLMKQLKDEFKCVSLEAAKKKMLMLEKEETTLIENIRSRMTEIEEKYFR